MKWLPLLLVIAISGCLLPDEGEIKRQHVNDGSSLEDSATYWENKEKIPMDVTPWEYGKTAIPHESLYESGVIFWFDTEGLHCTMDAEVEPYIEEKATIPDGEILAAYTWCIVSPDSIIEQSFRVSAWETSIDALVAPGLPDMTIEWQAWVVTEILYGNATHEEDFWTAAAWITRDAVQGMIEAGLPDSTLPTLEIAATEFCVGETNVRVGIVNPTGQASGWIDFSPSTPTATELGTIEGNIVRFASSEWITSFEVTVDPIPIGELMVDINEISCLADRTYVEQQWSAQIWAAGDEGNVEVAPAKISALAVMSA